jgi:hypothetical protein
MLGKHKFKRICVDVENFAGVGNKIAVLLALLPALVLIQY